MGNILSQTEQIKNPFKYAGEIYDAETGLYYLRARYYDPSIGRFINKDSYEGDITNPLSFNLYTYVKNNPLGYIDPSGHQEVGLRAWVERYGGSVTWDNDRKIATATLNGITQQFDARYFRNVDGRIVVDNFTLESKFYGPGRVLGGIASIASLGATTVAANVIKGAVQKATPYVASAASAVNNFFNGSGNRSVQAPQKVIGQYPEYVEMSTKFGTRPFSIPDQIWSKMTPAEQWAANQKFLDRAIAKGAEFNLATPLDKIRLGSFLQKEIEYLTSQGYKLSKDGRKLLK